MEADKRLVYVDTHAGRGAYHDGTQGSPLLIAQNPKDDLVAPSVTLAHARALCRSGNRLRYITINGEGHATSAKDSSAETLRWIADRFGSRAAPSDCGRI